jgi:hypothetical protein
MKNKIFFLVPIILLYSSHIIYCQQKFLLGDRLVSREEYDAALPYTIGDAVNFRDLPSIKDGKILAKINKGTILNISAVTEEKDIVYGDSFLWYEVSIRNDTNSLGHGWIYGKYIGFREGYEESFWKLEVVPASVFTRFRYTKELLSVYLYTDNNIVSSTWMLSKTPYSVEKPDIWYLSDYKLTKYMTDFGEANILINEDTNNNMIYWFIINKSNSSLMINVGDTINKLEKLLGTDYSIEDEIVKYNIDRLYNFFALQFKLNRNVIEYIECYYAFD